MLQDRGAMLTSFGIGVGLMYFLDPERGRRRRARVHDRIAHAANVGGDAAGATGRDVVHRTSGAAARLRGLLRRAPADDDVLEERVRAKLGRVVSHPHAIDVVADDGVVTLRGPILQAEVSRLLSAVERVRGVREIVPELEEHQKAANLPSLQGDRTTSGMRPDIWQRGWSPATRLITGTTGAALASYGTWRCDVPGAFLAAAGVGLVARAATNLETRRLTGMRARRRAVDVQKTITIDASRRRP